MADRRHSPKSAHRLVLPIGSRFGLLTVVRGLSPRRQRTRWRCRCDCGSLVDVQGSHLTSGHTQSCGCQKAKDFGNRNRKHGQSGDEASPEYISWKVLRSRCNNPNNPSWHRYGGRGVRVCKRWDDFKNFLADMGRQPSPKHSIDRYPNRDGDYKPSNCRWATPKQQANNTRANIRRRERQQVAVKLRKQGLTLQQIADIVGCSTASICLYLKN